MDIFQHSNYIQPQPPYGNDQIIVTINGQERYKSTICKAAVPKQFGGHYKFPTFIITRSLKRSDGTLRKNTIRMQVIFRTTFEQQSGDYDTYDTLPEFVDYLDQLGTYRFEYGVQTMSARDLKKLSL